MKKALFAIVFIVTCLYFFTGGNSALFSKLGKSVNTEMCDIDEDAPDNEEKDGKEDACSEEIFLEVLHASLISPDIAGNKLYFTEPSDNLPLSFLEQTSPPPRA